MDEQQRRETIKQRRETIKQMLMRPMQLQNHVPDQLRKEESLALGLADPTRAEDPFVMGLLKTKDFMRQFHIGCAMGDYGLARKHIVACINQAEGLLKFDQPKKDPKLKEKIEGLIIMAHHFKLTAEVAEEMGVPAIMLVEKGDDRQFAPCEVYKPE